MTQTKTDQPANRDFATIAMTVMMVVGLCWAFWLLIDSLNPDSSQEDKSNLGLVDLSEMKAGDRIIVPWEGKPIFVSYRTPEEIKEARSIDISDLPYPEADEDRVLKPEWLVVFGVGEGFGCVVSGQKLNEGRGRFGGWYDPCRGAHYDVSGRMRKGPSPANLKVPNYKFISEKKIQLLPSNYTAIPKLNPAWEG